MNMNNKYKMCPLKKRPVFYKAEIETESIIEPEDLSIKRKAEEECVNESKRNFVLNLSTNSVYDQLRRMNPVNWHTNGENHRPDSPVSNSSDSPLIYRETSTSPVLPEYNDIHLRGLTPYQINQTELLMNQQQPTTRYWSTSPPCSTGSMHHHQPYNLTPPSSPSSSSEPEDLSLKSYIPLPALYHGMTLPGEQKVKDSPRFKCDKCGKSYSTVTGLSKHQQFHCPAAECNQVKKCFSCKSCDKVYTSLGALKMHIRTHTLPCKCPICGKAFSRPWLLQGHIRTHTGEKPFSCGHCHRAFADRSNLRAHQQTHVDVKKYICEGCTKSFSRMSLLSKHTTGGCPAQNHPY